MHSKKESYSIIRESRPLKILFFVFFAAVIAALAYLFRFYFWPFLSALLLYMVLIPCHDRLLVYVRNRYISSTLIIIALTVLIVVPLFFLLVTLADQTFQLYLFMEKKISLGIIDQILKSEMVQVIGEYMGFDHAEILRKMRQSIEQMSVDIIKSITAVVSYPLNFLVQFLFMILMLFFFLKDGNRLASIFYRAMPFPDDIEQDVVERLFSVVKILFAGNFFIMILQGFMVGAGLAFFGFPMPLLWGSIAAVLSLIPVVGTTFIWIPASAFLMFNGDYVSGIVLALWCLVWYFLLENLVKPIVMGDRLRFHPLIFFFLLLGSIQTFGLAGVILGPVLLTLFYSLWEIYNLLNDYNTKHPDTDMPSGADDSTADQPV